MLQTYHQEHSQNLAFTMPFLCVKAGTAIVHLSHRTSVRLSVWHMGDQWKMVQAMITKSLPMAAWKTLGSGSMKLFHKFERGHLEQGC